MEKAPQVTAEEIAEIRSFETRCTRYTTVKERSGLGRYDSVSFRNIKERVEEFAEKYAISPEKVSLHIKPGDDMGGYNEHPNEYDIDLVVEIPKSAAEIENKIKAEVKKLQDKRNKDFQEYLKLKTELGL